MHVIAEIAIDRNPQELISAFVSPLDAVLQEGRFGCVTSYETEGPLAVRVTMKVSSSSGYERILEFFAEADATIGTVIYQQGWFGRKKNIFMVGP